MFVTGFGEGVCQQFHKPSRWAKDKTTLHTIILDNGEEVTKPWSECRLVEPYDSEGSEPDVSGGDSDGSDADEERQMFFCGIVISLASFCRMKIALHGTGCIHNHSKALQTQRRQTQTQSQPFSWPAVKPCLCVACQ